MNEGTPLEARTFAAPDGARWEARVIARGAASAYLSPKVGRPTVQFTRLEGSPVPPRYALLAAPSLAEMSEDALAALWARARVY
ncbi:MAG: hypothetical protein ABSB58_09190 [Gemmatimonadales bacterium]|jgi:hypothetical protein